ncbi:hypothetical protein [Algivirga pacifica]
MMQFKNKYIVPILLLALCFTACMEEPIEVEPQESFMKVFNHERYATGAYALGVTPLLDSGYFFVNRRPIANSKFGWGGNIMRTNSLGQILWEANIPDTYENVLEQPLELSDGRTFVVGMHTTSLATVFLMADPASGQTTEAATFAEFIYPLAATVTADNHFLLQYYNHRNYTTGLAKIDSNFEIVWGQEYRLSEDVITQNPIVSGHLNWGKRLPFFVEETADGNIVLNGLYNFSFALLFIDGTNGQRINEILGGQRYDAGIMDAEVLEGGHMAATVFEIGKQSIVPSAIINDIGQASDLVAMPYLGLDFRSESEVEALEVDGQKVFVFAFTNYTGGITVLVVDQETQEILVEKQFGEGQAYELADMAATADNGIIMLARTTMASKFQTTALIKVSERELTKEKEEE